MQKLKCKSIKSTIFYYTKNSKLLNFLFGLFSFLKSHSFTCPLIKSPINIVKIPKQVNIL